VYPSPELSGIALVTVVAEDGANIARELARAACWSPIAGRTADQVKSVADEIGGRAYVGECQSRTDVRGGSLTLEHNLLVCSAAYLRPQTTFAR